ncbi:hypothetical protein F5Y19DRAFT_486056 [Xylariaceae sp. FL1651]|nr:hypothetical protein F5Y19DRAFT_486056 [Xylariaceae sp. FL1651]
MEPKEPNTKLDKFHLFTELPLELQLLVWKFWREGRPVIHHYLFVSPKGRCYAALDTKRDKFIHTTTQCAKTEVRHGTSLNPMEYKIRFTNSVWMITDYQCVDFLVNMVCNAREFWPYFWGEGEKGTLYTWVNFEKDIFFVGSNYRWPGQLRFLFYRIGGKLPQAIKDDHWALRIQQLAMYVSDKDSLCELDRRAFSQLKHLRKVFLIVHKACYSQLEDIEMLRNWRGLVDLDTIIRKLVAVASSPRSIQMINHIRQEKANAEAIRAQILHICREGNRGHIVRVELVAEGSRAH